VKKLVIALVCVGLLVALTIPSIYSASKWGTYTLTLSGDVEVVLEDCGASRRCISSGYISSLMLCLDADKFGVGEGEYGGDHDAEGIVLSENKEGKITMQFFFFDKKGKKVVLKVEDGELAEGGWLSPIFTIKFNNDYAEITPATKGKKKILWGPGNVNITVECVLQE